MEQSSPFAVDGEQSAAEPLLPPMDTATFFTSGTSRQFEYVLKLYPAVLALKAAKRNKPDELIRLDNWYQNELPLLIKQRGKDAHMIHDELVQTMKWKQSRGKYYPQLSYLVKVNTPRAVIQETRKAFRKLPNLEQAITALSNLKGVGTTMASALLAAAVPERAPFMADECLMAIPEIEGIDYTTKEYLNFVQHIEASVQRLNANALAAGQAHWSKKRKCVERQRLDGETESGDKRIKLDLEAETEAVAAADVEVTRTPECSEADENVVKWSAHRVELALWTHYVASDIAPELLVGMPDVDAATVTATATTEPEDNETDTSQTGLEIDEEEDEDEDEEEEDEETTPTTTPTVAVEENTNGQENV